MRGSLRDLADIKRALDESAIVAITDHAGVITYVNDKFCEISGYTRDELLGNTHRLVNSGYHPRPFFEEMWRTIGAGKVWRREIRNRKKDGGHYWVHTTIVPFLDDGGRPYKYVAIRTDITERIQAEEKLQQAQDALMVQKLFAERLSALAALAGGIAHELNQPLSSIRVYAETLEEMIRRGTPPEPVRLSQTMAKIMRQVDRASRVIMHMRDFASEQTDRSVTVIELRHLVNSVLELIGEQLKNHGIACLNEVEPGVRIRANFNRMEQVLINLLSNSKDSIDEKADAQVKVVRLTSSQANGQVVLAVRDSGQGIPETVRPHLFEPFVTTKGPNRGTGLGLSICIGILRDYDASIRLAYSGPDGTEFHLVFPRVNG